MWRLWSGYVVALNGIIRLLRVFLTGCKASDLLGGFVFFLLRYSSAKRQQHFNRHSALLVTRGWMEMILCCSYIVRREGQSRVCARLFRRSFTYILSSWAIAWLSRFYFMRKVTIYGWPHREALIFVAEFFCGRLSSPDGPLALAFNSPQLFSNYFQCM